MKQSSWDAICRRCGACCFEKKIDRRGTVLTTSVPCRFLDIHERLCTAYEQRFQVMPDCIQLTPDNISTLKWLPQECAYRQYLPAQGDS
ncbi:MAG: YkgJ family cysteine cluster protein [Desulfuromonadales bacterium]|nr:YkgJ family cysteine cluster protein [Desulfuromonadales bacterium]MBN2793472.1 YkgJ family cysteine cluster protein [Desulfuromonadales bacterium]